MRRLCRLISSICAEPLRGGALGDAGVLGEAGVEHGSELPLILRLRG